MMQRGKKKASHSLPNNFKILILITITNRLKKKPKHPNPKQTTIITSKAAALLPIYATLKNQSKCMSAFLTM